MACTGTVFWIFRVPRISPWPHCVISHFCILIEELNKKLQERFNTCRVCITRWYISRYQLHTGQTIIKGPCDDTATANRAVYADDVYARDFTESSSELTNLPIGYSNIAAIGIDLADRPLKARVAPPDWWIMSNETKVKRETLAGCKDTRSRRGVRSAVVVATNLSPACLARIITLYVI